MRHLDRPQTPNARPLPAQYGLQSLENGPGEHGAPPVYVQDFQDQYRLIQAPFRGRAKSATSNTPAMLDADTAPPMPDLTQRSIHVPTRTR